jgi:hypothetical protein
VALLFILNRGSSDNNMQFPSASDLWIASLYCIGLYFIQVEKLPFYSRLLFSDQQQKISTGLCRLSFFLVLFNEVTYEVAKEARCAPQKYSVGIQGSVLMAKKLITCLHLMSRLRMSGAKSPLPSLTFTSCTGQL